MLKINLLIRTEAFNFKEEFTYFFIIFIQRNKKLYKDEKIEKIIPLINDCIICIREFSIDEKQMGMLEDEK